MEPSDPQTPTIRICVIVGDFFIMNTLRSHFNKFANNWDIVQQKLRTIHETLLKCLADENALVGKPDYQPGRVHLIDEDVVMGKSILSRLLVSRIGIDILSSQFSFPQQVILATHGGRYEVLDGFEFRSQGIRRHLPYKTIPAVLEAFEHQQGSAWTHTNIQFSLVS